MSRFADNKTQRFGWFRVDDKVKPNFGKMHVFRWITIFFFFFRNYTSPKNFRLTWTLCTKHGSSSFSPFWLEVFGSATLVLNFRSTRSFSRVRFGMECLCFYGGTFLHNVCQHFMPATPRCLLQARWENFRGGKLCMIRCWRVFFFKETVMINIHFVINFRWNRLL